jgi:hypothetical protein
MMEKKGQQMTIGTIIVIILSLIVLVVLIYGFTTGWGNLWQNILGFGGGKVNVQTVVQSCQLACQTSSQFDYCDRKRNVVFDDERVGSYSCKELERQGVGLTCDDINCPGAEDACAKWGGSFSESCEGNMGSVAVESEGSLQCCAVKRSCAGWSGRWIVSGSCNADEINGAELVTDSDKDAHPNQVCCVPLPR